MIRRWCVFVAAALVLAACNPLARDPQVDAEIRRVFDQLRHHEDAALIARLDPKLRGPNIAAQVAAVARFVPAGEPRSRQVIGTSTMQMASAGETVTATDEYDYGDRIAQVNTRLHRARGQQTWVVMAFHVNVATMAELARNKLVRAGTPPWQYGFFALVIVSPLVMIAALVKVIRTPGLKRKWLWGIVAFLGLIPLHLNWTTGQISYQLVAVQLIGAGVMRSLSAFSPWILSVCVPVGAVLILTGVWANPARARKPKPDVVAGV